MKEELLSQTQSLFADLSALQKTLRLLRTRQVQQKAVLDNGVGIARRWFDIVRPSLVKANFPAQTIGDYSQHFEELLLVTGGRPAKSTYLRVVDRTLVTFRLDIIHKIEISSFATTTGLSISPYLEGLPPDEGNYLDEAQRCLSVEALRGCIVLGWCATISRIHDKIEEIGFAKYSKATEEMVAKTSGRFKPYSKKFSIESMSELQRVFDTELLWALEYLGLIDSNQHARLRHCFDLRNHSAHPGLAPITGENLYSFFSDITKIVLKNPKFELKPREGSG
jgi:hypothetical protein